MKIQAEEEMREIAARVQEEEYKKWMSALKMVLTIRVNFRLKLN